jgi:pheromone shutdown-related protein TraB
MNSDSNPIFTVEHNDQRITVLGTAHVSSVSAEKVRELLASGEFDAVAVELCPGRLKKMTEPDSMAELDLFQVLKDGQAATVVASLALGSFQQRTAEQLDIEPGAEMRVAIDEADRAGYPVLLIDRDIGVTLKRIYRNIPFWQRSYLLAGLLYSVVTRRQVSEEEIERLKEGDVLESAFAQFAEKEHDLYVPLIEERDSYMAVRLIQEAADSNHRHIMAVVGAGHFKGIKQHLCCERLPSREELEEELEELNRVPAADSWLKWLPWLITVLILTGFSLGFSRSPDLGWQLISDWVLINGGLSALGALIAYAHPLTVAGAFVAAPITSLNPMIGAGMVTAAIEIWLRKPNVGDFENLRTDTAHLKGWWRNRVSRTLLVFLFATLGSAIGTYIAGFRILERLT